MKTWNELTAHPFLPEYIELVLDGDNGGEVVNALIFDGVRVDCKTIPEGFFPYAIRHSDEDWCEPATVENNVFVNFFGTILVDHDLHIPANGYIVIKDWSYKGWQDVAEEELVAAGISSDRINLWDNLAPISENIRNIRTQ